MRNLGNTFKTAQVLVTCAFILFGCSSISAQTIRPVLSEYRGKANGRFDVTNDSFVPVNVVLEPKSFSVDENGEIKYFALDPDISVKFSATSFRIQPKQTYTVSYEAEATKLPTYFVVYAAMSGMPVRTSTGLNIRVMLPHTVYILGKKDMAKPELEMVRAQFDEPAKKVHLEVHSRSANFGRVLLTEVVAGKKRAEGPGFPVYPGANRKMDVDWSESTPPERVVLTLKDFKIEAPVTR